MFILEVKLKQSLYMPFSYKQMMWFTAKRMVVILILFLNECILNFLFFVLKNGHNIQFTW